jgi:hypothetical protein
MPHIFVGRSKLCLYSKLSAPDKSLMAGTVPIYSKIYTWQEPTRASFNLSYDSRSAIHRYPHRTPALHSNKLQKPSHGHGPRRDKHREGKELACRKARTNSKLLQCVLVHSYLCVHFSSELICLRQATENAELSLSWDVPVDDGRDQIGTTRTRVLQEMQCAA